MRHSVMACATASLAVLALASAAHSQESGAEGATVDEIVVTAQKREQSLQDVPIVVTAIQQQLLQDAGVKDIKDLTILAPGLSVTSTSSEVSTTARIRGVGTVGDNIGLESSVGVVVDGVYRPRTGVAFGDLGELQRIEVLKGPQGTLFGKNTSAGVINILTKRPEFQFGADAEATVSNFNGRGGSVSVTGPIVEDQLAGRLFVAARKRDGYLDVNTGAGPRTLDNDQNQDFYTLRGQALYAPADGFNVNVIADYSKRQESCCAGVQIIDGPTAAIVRALSPGGASGVAIPAAPFDRMAYANRPNTQNIEDAGISAEANWDLEWLGGATLTSITAYRDWKRLYGSDGDFTNVDIIYSPNDGLNRTQFKQFSQELRLAGASEKLNWLVGAFYANEKLISNNSQVRYGNQFETYASLLFSGGTNPNLVSTLQGRPTGTSYAPGAGQQDRYDQDGQTFALFTNNSYQVTDQLELTAGLRYTHEKKDLDTRYDNTDGGLGCATLATRLGQSATAIAVSPLQCATFQNYLFNDLQTEQSISEEAVTGTVKAAYRINEQVLAYGSYARGYKAGGYNLDRLACPYQANTTMSNACVASITASGRPLAPNPQQSASAQGSLQPIHDTSFAPEFVDSYELGLKNTLLDRTLLLNATIFYQKFTDFQLNAFNGIVFTVTSVPEVVSRGIDTDVVYMPTRGLTIQGGLTYAETQYADKVSSKLGQPCTGGTIAAPLPAGCSRLPGSRLSLAPLYSASGAVTYEHAITGDLMGRVNVSAKYTSTANTGSDLNPLKVQKGFTLVNARVSVGPEDEKWALELWGQNVFDEDYYQVAYDGPAQAGTYNAFLGQPRTYGATVRVSF